MRLIHPCGMSFPQSDSSSSPFDSFCFRGTVKKRERTQRLKRVAEPTSPAQPTEPEKKPRRSKSTNLSAKPNPISESPTKMEILPRNFFQIDALDLAPRLLGKFLRRDDVVLQITEVCMLHSPLFTFDFDCNTRGINF